MDPVSHARGLGRFGIFFCDTGPLSADARKIPQAGETRSSDGSSSFPQMIGRGTGSGVILFRFPVYRYSGLPSIGFFDKNVTNFLWEKLFFRAPIPENPRRTAGILRQTGGPPRRKNRAPP